MSTQELIFLNYLSKVFENLEDAIMLFEVGDKKQLELQLVNYGFFRMTGLPQSSINDVKKVALKHPANAQFSELLAQSLSTKDIVQSRVTQSAPRGQIIADVKIIPVLTSLGEVSYLILLARDITELIGYQNRITELEQKLSTNK